MLPSSLVNPEASITVWFVWSLWLRAAEYVLIVTLYNGRSQCTSPSAPLPATQLISYIVTEEDLLQCILYQLSVMTLDMKRYGCSRHSRFTM